MKKEFASIAFPTLYDGVSRQKLGMRCTKKKTYFVEKGSLLFENTVYNTGEIKEREVFWKGRLLLYGT